MTTVHEARFVVSCARSGEFPATGLPEIAFVGRSNVGKSSLMNLLLGRRLVKVSRTPGKTQTLNFFEVNRVCYLVDVPGYGYARAPASVRAAWRGLIEAYLSDRPTLRAVVFVLDPRRPPTDLDQRMREWFDSFRMPMVFVATKCDQLSRQHWSNAARGIREALQVHAESEIHFTSAKSGEGKSRLWSEILRLIQHPAT